MTGSVKILDLTVIGPFMGHIERGRYRAAVGIDTAFFEKVLVQNLVEVIDGVVECQQHDLWNTLHRQVPCGAARGRVEVRVIVRRD